MADEFHIALYGGPGILGLFSEEGGLSNDPRDPGGLTNYGVTLKTAIALGFDPNKDGVVNALDIRNLTKPQAEIFYRLEFWDAIQGTSFLTASAIA